jgi:hypothetical protein
LLGLCLVEFDSVYLVALSVSLVSFLVFGCCYFKLRSIKLNDAVDIGGGMAKAGVGFSPGQDFINIFLLVLCKTNS